MLTRERGEHASATHEEMLYAVTQARRALGACAQVLQTDKPFGLGMSGNGAHTGFKLGDLPNTDEVEDLLWGLLHGLAHQFGDAKLKGDLSVCDARRLTPAFGTMKRKGEDTAERPHRQSFFVCHPDAVGLTLDQLRQLHAAFAVSGEPRRGTSQRDRGQYVEDTGSVWHRCGQVNIRDVAGRLGIDTDNPRCPVCDGGEGGRGSASSCAYLDEKPCINVIKCQHATCGQRAFGPVGLVAYVMAGADSLRGDKEACAKVLRWFEQHFGIKAELPPEAYEGDGESMMVDGPDDEPMGVFEIAAPKLAVVKQLPGTDERPTIVVSTQQGQGLPPPTCEQVRLLSVAVAKAVLEGLCRVVRLLVAPHGVENSGHFAR